MVPLVIVELDALGPADHGDGLADAGHLQLGIDRDLAGRHQADVLELDGREAAELGLDGVGPGLEGGQAEEAPGVGHRGAAAVGVPVGDGDAGAGDEAARGVPDGAGDGTAGDLRGGEGREREDPDQGEDEKPRENSVHFIDLLMKTGRTGKHVLTAFCRPRAMAWHHLTPFDPISFSTTRPRESTKLELRANRLDSRATAPLR